MILRLPWDGDASSICPIGIGSDGEALVSRITWREKFTTCGVVSLRPVHCGSPVRCTIFCCIYKYLVSKPTPHQHLEQKERIINLGDIINCIVGLKTRWMGRWFQRLWFHWHTLYIHSFIHITFHTLTLFILLIRLHYMVLFCFAFLFCLFVCAFFFHTPLYSYSVLVLIL